MLHSTYRFLAAMIVTFSLLGCQKVIDLKVKPTAKKYVIEGNMSDQYNDCRVAITTTINLNEESYFEGVSDAKVSIQEDDKSPVILSESVSGLYESSALRAKPGRSYTLRVEIKDEVFTSTVSVPQKVQFDTLYIIDFMGFGSSRKFANIEFRDPPGVPNSYRFLQFKNGIQNSNIFIVNDDFADGRAISTFLAFFDQSDVQKLSPGDTVTVQMQGIDASVYNYFNSLSMSSTGGNEVATPGNPVTNIKGGALGYFNAFIKQERTVVVPE